MKVGYNDSPPGFMVIVSLWAKVFQNSECFSALDIVFIYMIAIRNFFYLLTLSLTALHLYVWTLPRTPTAVPEVGTPEAHWWGIWPVTSLPGWVLIGGVGVVLLTFIWGGQWARLPALVARQFGRLPQTLGWIVLIGLFIIAFYTFPIVHTRWGDAYILTKALALKDPALRLTHSWQAPLDVRLHSQLWITFHDRFGWRDAMPVYHLLSPVAGLLYLVAAVGVSRLLAPLPAWLTCALLTSLGVMQLFFGYIENYSFAAAGILLYLWLGLAVLQGRRPLWHAALALAVTNALHPSTLVYGLSLLYCGWRSFAGKRQETNHGTQARGDERKDPATKAGPQSPIPNHPPPITHPRTILQLVLPFLLVGGGTILLMQFGGHGIGTLFTTDRPGGGDARWLVPLWTTTTRWEQYTLFSWPHLRDIINQQLLVAPIVLPGLIILFVSGQWTVRRKQWAGFGTAGSDHSPFTIYHSQFAFLTLATLAHLLLICLWNPDYGGQRDWDLFSLAAIPLTVLFAYLLAHTMTPSTIDSSLPTTASRESSSSGSSSASSSASSTQRIVLAGLIPLLVLQYLHTAAWIYQNTLPWEWP